MEPVGFVVGVAIIIYIIRLGSRVKALENKLSQGVEVKQISQVVPPISLSGLSTSQQPSDGFIPLPEEQARVSSESVEVSDVLSPEERLIAWLREDWLLKLGALLVLIGVGWFISYAFANNWIGPLGQISLGLLAGSLVLLLGAWRIKNHVYQGGVFLTLGSTIIILTTYAARSVYGMFTPASALLLMLLSIFFVALMSALYRRLPLALISLILAGIIPFMVGGSFDYNALFAYLLIIIIGTIWVVAITGFDVVATAGVVLVALYSLPHLTSFNLTGADEGTLLLFAYAFAGLFFVANVVGFIRRPNSNLAPAVITAIGNGLLLLAWIIQTVPANLQSLTISAWMVVFVVGAFVALKLSGRQEPFYVYVGLGVVMLATATATELSGPALTIAYTLESALLILGVSAVVKKIEVTEMASFVLIGPAALSLPSLVSSSWRGGIWHGDLAVLSILAVTLMALGYYLWHKSRLEKSTSTSQAGLILAVLGSIYWYAIIWLCLHSLAASADTAVTIALIIYTLIGLGFYVLGRLRGHLTMTSYGGVLLIFVVGRLLTIDVWQMDIIGRVVVFLAVGVLLISTAFIGRRPSGGGIIQK
jgi:uncharacterized membrane protein